MRAARTLPESLLVGNLMARVIGVQRSCKEPDDSQSDTLLSMRRCLAGPFQHPIGTHECVAMLFGESSEARAMKSLRIKFESKRSSRGCVLGDSLAQHSSPPGPRLRDAFQGGRIE